MPRSSLDATNSTLKLSDLPYLSSRAKDPSGDQNISNTFQDRPRGSVSAAGPEVEFGRLEEGKLPKTPNPSLPIEERIAFLEEKISQLKSTTTADRTLSEYGHEQISEIDFARYVPQIEIVRIPSEDWHEKKGGKFAVPEKSVLTVSTTSRHWAGRNTILDTHNGIEETRKTDPSSEDRGDMSLTASTPERPYRLAINGFDLHRALETIFGLPISLNNNVWIWPFKHFITYESQIRQRLHTEKASVREMQISREKYDASVTFERHAPETNGIYRADEEDATETSPEEQQYEMALRLCGQLECLVQFMDEDMKDIFSIKKKIADGSLRTIPFAYLWLLYKPGDLIFSGTNQRRAYRVLHLTGGRAILDIGDQPSTNNRSTMLPVHSWEQHEDQAVTFAYSKNTPFVIDTFYIDFDGEKFGPVPRTFAIQEYEGWQAIDSLPAFPAKFDKNVKDTENRLAQRGRRFVNLAGVTHKRYKGLSAREPSVADYQEELNSDVVIDFEEAIKKTRKENPGWDVGFGAGVVHQATRADPREIHEIKPCATKGCTLCKQSDIFDDSYLSLENRNAFLDDTTLLRYRIYGKEDLDSDQIILLPPRVYGYSLLDRFWYPLNIDLVEDIKTGTHNGFDDLVLPGDHKRIMQALVKHHTRGPRPTSGQHKTATDFSTDLVRGKGRGLIILLHGVPGVGKTSTAECVAAQTKRPLFPITCGDIGTTASEVEGRLERYFDLAHKWGCVLLLDEADVYLASRERGGDLQRNSLVSVFLRVLEYYSGILILTTNRVGEFDEAFKSRIHISLYYPRLDHKSTVKIWEMNLKRIQRSGLDMDIDKERILKFAQTHWAASKKKLTRRWNGRQIKNAFQTAIALASWDFNDEHECTKLERPLLSDKHFRIVSETSAHFDDYLSNVHGIDEDDAFAVMAERENLRNDSVLQLERTRRRDFSTRHSKPGRAIRGVSQHDSSDEEKTDASDDHDVTISEMELELKLRKMKTKRKSSTKGNVGYGGDRRRERSRRSLSPTEESSEKSDDD